MNYKLQTIEKLFSVRISQFSKRINAIFIVTELIVTSSPLKESSQLESLAEKIE